MKADDELTAEECELINLLVRNGWKWLEAKEEAVRALADAAEEDGM